MISKFYYAVRSVRSSSQAPWTLIALDSDLMSAGYERFEEAQEELVTQQITASSAMQRELIAQMFTVSASILDFDLSANSSLNALYISRFE